MGCRVSCLCQCHQHGCGCNERPKPYVPDRDTTPPVPTPGKVYR